MANDEDIVSARSTYGSFLTLFKVGTIASAVLAILVILLIAPK